MTGDQLLLETLLLAYRSIGITFALYIILHPVLNLVLDYKEQP